MRFYLGSHQVCWLARTAVPLFVSAVRLRQCKRLPRALGPWACDSGGFSEIAAHGRWTVNPRQYVEEVQRWRAEVGGMEWAAIQDWMCEPHMLAKTGRTVAEHQQLTVNSWVILNSLDGSIPWAPVLQGWTVDDYHRCADLYERHAATNLAALPVVGVGSVCRRQGTKEGAEIVKSLHARGLTNLHGFGFKTLGLVGRERVAGFLASSDSMAWSTRARNEWNDTRRRLCGTDHKGGCGNCMAWALKWRQRLTDRIAHATRHGTQTLLF